MDTLLRNARVLGRDYEATFDIGIEAGRIVAIELPGAIGKPAAQSIDVEGKLVSPSFVETHIHLDKSCILDRCTSEQGTLDEAIAQVALQKKAFTEQDVTERARRTLEKAIAQGTGVMRTHVEVDPVVGLRGFEGVLALVQEYRWAIDIEVCVFPQEGLISNPGTDELLVAAMKQGASVIGAAPYCDSDPHAQIDRIFEIAREFDADIDMHLDFGMATDHMDIEYVCDMTEKHRYGGRVAIGHVTKLAMVEPERFARIAQRLADSGVAVTVLPATDLYLMGRDRAYQKLRCVLPVHELLAQGVNGNLSSNNILNPFTPFGDCSLLRMANLYANVCHVGRRDDIRECFDMVTRRSARLLRRADYGVEVGLAADLVVIDTTAPEHAVAELPPVLMGFKHGRMTFSRQPVTLHRP
ncbi:MAG: amidohydrolase family protein [Pseudomonadota bacterium]